MTSVACVPTERWRDELKKCGKPYPIRTLSVADLRSSSTPGIEVFVRTVLFFFLPVRTYRLHAKA